MHTVSLSLSILLLALDSTVGDLTKKYTIRLPTIATLTGRRIPIGRLCTEPVNLLVQTVNARKDVLPDYNIEVDYIDDQCTPALATVKAIKAYEEMKQHQQTGSATGNVFNTPLMTGPLCSESCIHASRFLQYYDLYTVANICLDNKLTNQKLYPNFLQYIPSTVQHSQARVALMKHFGWTKVGIISDTTGFMFSDVQLLMEKLQEANIEVVAEEFYIKDIDRSIDRLMKAEARVFFALCYLPSCPLLACSIVKKGFYGNNVVWIFPTYFTAKQTKACNEEEIFRLNEGTLYVGSDNNGVKMQSPSEIGISKSDVVAHIEKHLTQKELNSPLRNPTLYLCFQTVHAAIYLLDSVEKTLQLQNETIKDYIGTGEAQWKRLSDAIRVAGLDLNITGIIGPSRFIPGTRTGYAPWIIVEQTTIGVRRTVASFDHSNSNFILWENFTWRTTNGKVPKSWPDTVVEWLIMPPGWIIFVKAIAALLLVAFLVVIALLVKHRSHEKVAGGVFSLNIAVTIGMIFTLTAVFFYPENQMATEGNYYSLSLFCKIAPALIIVGNSLAMAGLVSKVILRFVAKQRNFKTEMKALSALILWVLVNLGLYLAMFFTDNYPPMAREFSKVVDDHLQLWQLEEIRIQKWRQCEIGDKYKLGLVTVVLQAFLGLIGVIIALFSKYRPGYLAITDFRACGVVIQLIFPIGILLLFVLFVSGSHLAEFAVTATFGPAVGAVLLAVYGTFFFTSKIPVEVNLTASKSKASRLNRSTPKARNE